MNFPEWDRLQAMRHAAARRRAETRVQAKAEASKAAAPGWGEQAADFVAALVGSWRFILVQSTLLIGWLVWNSVSGRAFDPFPFILLNLVLSFQAAYTAPIIMMSQNRTADIDRQREIQDYDINCKAELEIELLHQKVDLLKEQEIAHLVRAIEKLTDLLEARSPLGKAVGALALPPKQPRQIGMLKDGPGIEVRLLAANVVDESPQGRRRPYQAGRA